MKSMAAFLVTWRIVGYSMAACQDPKLYDPIVKACVATVDFKQSVSFDHKQDAVTWAHKLKSVPNDKYKVTEVHMYSEEGAK